MTIECCKCKRIRIEGEWKRPAVATTDDVSHTYCPPCLIDAQTEIKRSVRSYRPTALIQVPVFAGAPFEHT